MTNSLDQSWLVRATAWTRTRPWLAVVAWVVILVASIGIASAAGSAFEDDYSMPGTESQELANLLGTHAPSSNDPSIQVVFAADDGIAAYQGQIDGAVDALGALPGVTSVQSAVVADNGDVAYAELGFNGTPEEATAIVDAVKGQNADGLTVVAGGDAVREVEEGSGGGGAEGVGMLTALVILVLWFGSFIAAGLPLLSAIFAVGSAYGIVMLASNVMTLPTYLAPNMFLIGIGVGIDYALLIFARYRSELLAGATSERALTTAIDRAGRSVLFAGSVVVFALLGLFALGLASLQSIALGVALTVLMTMLASVTLLPALLTLLSGRIDRAVSKRAAKHRHGDQSRWWRWSAFVEKRAWPAVVVVIAGLVVLAVPALDMRLGFADAGTESAELPSRQAYDLLSDGFGKGFNGPLIVSTEGSQADADAAAAAMSDVAGVAAVRPPVPIADNIWLSIVMPDGGPSDQATIDVVHELRGSVLPEAPGAQLVGGSTAAAIDFADAIQGSVGLFLLFVVGLSVLILMMVFRSVVLPIKAAALNVLMVAASLGVVTTIFQNGWFGIEPGPIEAFVPVMLFALVFGLSMDYEVFLVSRMREEWVRTGSAIAAVRGGLVSTGGVVTAAGAIMIAVFVAFALSDVRMLQQFGIGMAVAVFLDAFVIRCLLVPAIMRLLGERAWWMPRWLESALPQVTIEPERELVRQ